MPKIIIYKTAIIEVIGKLMPLVEGQMEFIIYLKRLYNISLIKYIFIYLKP